MCRINHLVRRCSVCNTALQGRFEKKVCHDRRRFNFCPPNLPTRIYEVPVYIPPEHCYECLYYRALWSMAPTESLVYGVRRKYKTRDLLGSDAGSDAGSL